jgi:hypothetical protein
MCGECEFVIIAENPQKGSIMKIVNLTPHPLNIMDVQGNTHDVPTLKVNIAQHRPEETGELYVIARKGMSSEIEIVEGFEVARTTFTQPFIGLYRAVNDADPVIVCNGLSDLQSWLPVDLQHGFVVVSRLYLDDDDVQKDACANGVRLVAPGTLQRDEAGKVIGAKGFSR